MTDQYQAQRILNDDQFTMMSSMLKGQKWTKRHPGFTATTLNGFGHGYEAVKNGGNGEFIVVARYV